MLTILVAINPLPCIDNELQFEALLVLHRKLSLKKIQTQMLWFRLVASLGIRHCSLYAVLFISDVYSEILLILLECSAFSGRPGLQ